MRILHVLDHSAPLQSGYTFRTLSILREQRRRGWETEQVTGAKHASEALEEETEGLRFYRTPRERASWTRLPVLRQTAVITSLQRRLTGLAGDLRPDLIHAHSPALNGVAALRVGRTLRIPIVYEVRAFWEDAAVDHGTSREGGLRYRLTRGLETHVLRRADAVTTICEGLAEDIVARGIPRDRVTVIPNAVDVEQFAGDAARDPDLTHRLGLTAAEVVGFIGSFYAYEGLDLLLQAMPALVRLRPRLRLLLVGGGPQDEVLRSSSRRLGLEGRVIFAGRVPFDEVRRYYDLVDVLAYPRHSMRLTETVTPLKPLEAMAMGKLVLASDVGGHRELIRHDRTGLLFRAGDVEDLTRALTGLLETPERAQRLRHAARTFVERERTWARSVARYETVYTNALNGRR